MPPRINESSNHIIYTHPSRLRLGSRHLYHGQSGRDSEEFQSSPSTITRVSCIWHGAPRMVYGLPRSGEFLARAPNPIPVHSMFDARQNRWTEAWSEFETRKQIPSNRKETGMIFVRGKDGAHCCCPWLVIVHGPVQCNSCQPLTNAMIAVSKNDGVSSIPRLVGEYLASQVLSSSGLTQSTPRSWLVFNRQLLYELISRATRRNVTSLGQSSESIHKT